MNIVQGIPKLKLNRRQDVWEGDETLDFHEVAEFNKAYLTCPMTEQSQCAGMCFACPHFGGVGEVDIFPGEESPPIEQKYRISCGYPKRRPLRPTSIPIPDIHKKEMAKQIEFLPDGIDKDDATAHFVHQNVAINCPLARIKTRVWRVDGAPCPACGYYKGIEERDGKPHVLCGHSKNMKFSRIVLGSALMEM